MANASRILIVEDETTVAKELAGLLQESGYRVVGEAEYGEDAVRAAHETLPDLVLMDIRLKGRMDGITAASLIRARIDVPIVYLTAFAEKGLFERSKPTEPYAYVSKPISPHALLSTVEIALYRHQMEKRLRESEERLELALEGASVGLWDWNVQTGEVISNPLAVEMLGYTVGEAAPHISWWKKLAHPDDVPVITELLERHLQDESATYEAEYRMRAKSGEWKWILSRGRVVQRDGGGKPLRAIGTNADITERKGAEEALRAERDRAQLYLDIVGVVVVALSPNGEVTLVNRRGAQLLGYDPAEIVGKNWFDHFLPEAIRNEVKAVFLQLMAGGIDPVEHFENPVVTKSGEERIIEWSNTILRDKDGAITGTLSSGEDITERKRAEEELRASETRYQALFNDSKDGVYAVTRDGKILDANQSFLDIFGYTRDEMIGSMIQDLYVHPSERFHFQRAIEETGSVKDYEITLRNRAGEVLYCIVTSTLRRGEDGEILGYQGMLRDVTEQKRIEEERVRLAAAVEQADEVVVITDTQGTIQYVNPAFERTTGYGRQEAIGQNPRILKSGEQSGAFYGELWETITTGKVWRGRFVNKRRDETLYEEEAAIFPIKDESGRVVNFVAVKRDVTNELMLQKQLIQAQRMEAVGNLAGGIAHDFNNLLQVVLGFADVLLHEKKAGDPAYDELHTIRKAAKDGSDLVKQILTFSRKVETHPRPINLNNEVKRVKKLLYRTIPKMIEIELELADHLKATNADPGQIEQVLLNLAVNAKDAMPESGRLIIETRNVSLDEDYCRSHLDARPGDHVLLMISDTGHGMEAHVAERIFEPFYTTKQPGEGTGLGLAMVFGIVKNHGGHITCYSAPGAGTTFKIYLPVIKTVVRPGLVSSEAFPTGGKETLLVVDDENRLRELAEKILTRAGYTVLLAESGVEALAIYGERQSEISLVILDLIMPGMGGKECLERLLEIDPGVKILISSGFSANGPTEAILEAGSRDFLGKPYDAVELLARVRAVLDRE